MTATERSSHGSDRDSVATRESKRYSVTALVGYILLALQVAYCIVQYSMVAAQEETDFEDELSRGTHLIGTRRTVLRYVSSKEAKRVEIKNIITVQEKLCARAGRTLS